MQQIPLGRSGLAVSEFCLGTMTWGNRNDAAEGAAQIDLARDRGVTFLDTAEMYPVNPVAAGTVGRTEEIVGAWVGAGGDRDGMVIATKLTGPGQAAVRDGAAMTPATLTAAAEASLRRLGTDVIDLYQLHWPNRGAYHFRQGWSYAPKLDRAAVEADMTALLEAAADLVRAGKIRHFALSNETAWGTAAWLRLARAAGLPEVVSLQNEYSLLCRSFDLDLAELSVAEDVPLLAYSPLGAGLLTGKYAGDVTPEGTRRAANPTLGGRITPRVFEAVSAYLGIAARHGLDPAQMALAWCRTRPFTVIPILGATSTEQLRTALDAADLVLAPEVIADIDAAHRAHPMPY